jgi:molecular chaperone DnaK (HSP70)
MLMAALVGWVVDRAEEIEGMPATQLVVTHPVGWGTHRRAALLGALRDVNLPELTLLPRPVAAAEAHAAGDRVEVGEQLAVYSLGAGRFEAAVLRRGAFGFELCGHADSVEMLGGALFDDLLADHVLAELGDVAGASLAGLRGACVEAKERLSTEIAVTIPAPPGTRRASVAVSRSAFEQLVRPAVESTVDLLVRTIKAAEAKDAELRAVVLVGGSARIPLVAELVAAAVRARVVAAADPGTAIARGAALAAAKVAKPTVRAPALAVTPTSSVTQHTDLMRMDEADFDDDLPDLGEVADIGPPPPRPPVEIQPLDPPPRGMAKMTRRAQPDTRPRDQDRAWDFEDDDSQIRPRRRRDYAEATEDDR